MHLLSSASFLPSLTTALGVWAMALAPVQADPRIESVSEQATFPFEYTKASDFSGLTWVGSDGYYAVSNRAKAMFPLVIELDAKTGKITDLRFGQKIPIKTKADDLEGIAWVAETQRVYLSSESIHGIIGFDREGDARFAVAVPPIFQRARNNKSLESLTNGAGAFWTANEDALTVDGPVSSATKGALVRLQKFDADFRPLAQYAYRTETSLVRAQKSGTGVTDLCALPNGDLLVLERVVGLGLEARIYLVRFDGATETSQLSSLSEHEVQPVKKILLFERHTLTKNFEGIALGPTLADGSRSLLLIADSGGDAQHTLIPLRIYLEPKAGTSGEKK